MNYNILLLILIAAIISGCISSDSQSTDIEIGEFPINGIQSDGSILYSGSYPVIINQDDVSVEIYHDGQLIGASYQNLERGPQEIHLGLIENFYATNANEIMVCWYKTNWAKRQCKIKVIPPIKADLEILETPKFEIDSSECSSRFFDGVTKTGTLKIKNNNYYKIAFTQKQQTYLQYSGNVEMSVRNENEVSIGSTIHYMNPGESAEFEITVRIPKLFCKDAEYTNNVEFFVGQGQTAILEKTIPIRIRIGNSISSESQSIAYCGDTICNEPSYARNSCRDCFTKNAPVKVECPECGPEFKSRIDYTTTYQAQVVSCLENKFSYSLPATITFTMKPHGPKCSGISCTITGLPYGYNLIQTDGFIGVLNNGETVVSSVDNVRADVHETMHVFTGYYLGNIPFWFNEGISIYVNEKLSCHPKQFLETRYSGDYGYRYDYQQLKSGKVRIDDYRNHPHAIGTMFIIGLEEDYGCNDCFFEILRRLHTIRETNADIAIRVVDTDTIIRVSREVTGRDITPLVNLLDLKNQY